MLFRLLGGLIPGFGRLQRVTSAPVDSLTVDLRAWWKLDEESTGDPVDRVSEVNGLTLVDSFGIVSKVGKFGNSAAEFLLSSGYLRMSADPLLSFTGSYTISFWVYFNALPAAGKFGYMICKDGSGREYIINYYTDASGLRLYHFGSGGFTLNELVVIPTTGVWHNIIVWYDSENGTTNISYDNGTPSTVSGATDPIETSDTFTIGASDTGTNNLDGRIDNIRMYSRVLTADERTRLQTEP